MKNYKRMIVCLTVLVLLFANASAVMAAETKVLYGNLTEPVLEVTNVLGWDTVFGVDTGMGVRESYLCQAPVTVTNVIDDICFFPARQLIPVDGELYYSSMSVEPVGNIYEYSYDEQTQQATQTIVPYNPEIHDVSGFVKGGTITITKPGIYEIGALFPAVYEGVGAAYLNVIGDAQPTASKVYVNGVETAFEAYNIADNNYFKLRDVALAISGTEKQYNVVWDEEKQAIELLSLTPYTVVGGELSMGEMKVKTAQATASRMYKDGLPIGFTAYTIGDNNYFMLRDLGEVFDFAVLWDEATGSIHIDTTKPYEAE